MFRVLYTYVFVENGARVPFLNPVLDPDLNFLNKLEHIKINHCPPQPNVLEPNLSEFNPELDLDPSSSSSRCRFS